MVHINDLDPKVLYRILCLASGDLAENIDEWKHKLYLLQVCTKWYDLLKHYVFSQGFVDIYPLESNEYSGFNLISCVYYADNDIVCRSNLGIITGRDKYNCGCVSKLKVIAYPTTDTSQYFHILKNLLALGVGYWLNISSLSFVAYSIFKYSSNSKVMCLEDFLAIASNYIHDFQNSLPNITHLDVRPNKDVFLRTALFILINHYAPRLQLLHLNFSFKYPFPLFSTELTSLSLNLKDYTYRHPSFYAKSLQYLRLDNISNSNFSWWIFHDFTMPGRIEFTNLKTLDLIYRNQMEKERELSEKYSKQARPYGTHMLQFPKLENLTLWNSPVDCDVLFTDTMPTHLKELAIRGHCDSVVAASKLRFKSISRLYIDVYGEDAPNNNFYIAADRYFGYTKIESSCRANTNLSIDIQRTVSWVNVTHLDLHRIGFDELLQYIPNFYNLRSLCVRTICLSDELLTIIRFGLKEEEQGSFDLLDTKLEFITINNTEPNDPYNLLAILNHLLLRTITLKDIGSSYGQSGLFKKSFLPGKFPHVRFR